VGGFFDSIDRCELRPRLEVGSSGCAVNSLC
jgi:hypothetical protein